MNTHKTPTRARKTITAFTITNEQLAQLDAMAGVGNRSAFLRALIEAEYQKRQEQK